MVALVTAAKILAAEATVAALVAFDTSVNSLVVSNRPSRICDVNIGWSGGWCWRLQWEFTWWNSFQGERLNSSSKKSLPGLIVVQKESLLAKTNDTNSAMRVVLSEIGRRKRFNFLVTNIDMERF